MKEITYRNITDQDLHECAQVFWETFGPHGCGETWTLESSLQALKQNIHNKNFCFVATHEQEIVGLVVAFPIVGETGNEVFVYTVCVINEHQGSGIGKELLRKVKEVSKVQGIQHLRLLAHPKYLSYDWYQHLGMKPSGWVELEMAI